MGGRSLQALGFDACLMVFLYTASMVSPIGMHLTVLSVQKRYAQQE